MKLFKAYKKQSNLTINLKRCINGEAQRLKKSLSFNFNTLTGLWMPQAELSTIGVQHRYGFQLGFGSNKTSVSMVLSFKNGQANNFYNARRNSNMDSTERTNHFSGGYLGLEIGQDLISSRRHKLQLQMGFGADGFTALETLPENAESYSTPGSFNTNVGVGYKWFFHEFLFIGLNSNYNFLDYTRQGFIDLKGNVITVNLQLGIELNKRKSEGLRTFRYME